MVPAPLLKRGFAGIVDIAIVSAIFYVVAIVLVFAGLAVGVAFMAIFAKMFESGASTGAMVAGAILLFVFLLAMMSVWHLYFIYFEYKHGATPGKKMMGLKVVSIDGGPITRSQAVYRDVVRWYVDFLFFLPAIIAIACTKNRQRVGDLLANTMVVHSTLSEERQTFMYVTREEFVALKEHLQPRPVPADVRKAYLKFASQALLVGETDAAGERGQVAQAEWLKWIRSHLDRSDALGINDFTILRFFAELCFQDDLHSHERNPSHVRTV